MVSVETHRELYATLMESQFWARKEIEKFQHKRLERLLNHARNYAPFYKDRLDVAFDAKGSLDWSRWRDIPILTRQDLGSHGAEMESSALPMGHGDKIRSTTSGSTGIAITAVASTYANAVSRVMSFRGQSWHGADWSKDVLFYMEQTPAGAWPNVEVGPPWGPIWLPHATGRFLRLNGDTPPARVIDVIAERDEIHYLSCRAKVAQVLALESLRAGRGVNLDGVFAFSTATYDDERKDIHQAFGAKVVSFYSSKEGHLMAYQCPEHSHLHISEELVLVELLDDQGRPVPRGAVGNVVVTNLINWAQPLIRYWHGDLAIEGERCSCGRTLRVLEKIVGRESDIFRFPDGTTVALGVPNGFKAEFNIKTWQVAQVGPLALEVRYAPIIHDQPLDGPALVAALRSMTHPDVEISFKQSNSFLPADGRKFTEYVNETSLAAQDM